MEVNRSLVVLLIIAGLIGAGCESEPTEIRGSQIVEYKPPAEPVTKAAPFSAVYVLWQWKTKMVGADPTTMPATPPGSPAEMAVDLKEIFTSKGEPLGFARRNGQLVAVAGTTTVPLVNDRYTWNMRPGDPSDEKEAQKMAGEQILGAIFVVVVIAAGIAVVIYEVNH